MKDEIKKQLEIVLKEQTLFKVKHIISYAISGKETFVAVLQLTRDAKKDDMTKFVKFLADNESKISNLIACFEFDYNHFKYY